MATNDSITSPRLSHPEQLLLYIYRELSSEEKKLFLAAATCHDKPQREAYLAQLSPLALDVIIHVLKPTHNT